MSSSGGGLNRKFKAKGAYDFNSLLLLQDSTRMQETGGKADYTWSTLDEVWADVVPLMGVKLFYANQLAPKATIEVVIRFRPDMHAGMRFLDGNTIYLLKAPPINEESRNVYLRCTCEERQVGVVI